MKSATAAQEDLLPEQILQAATQLYQKHGLKKVTMDDVSKVIGKSRSSIYYYYKNKDEIFEAVMDALIREVMKEIENAVNEASALEDKIRSFCVTKIKTSEERKAFFTAIEAGMDIDEMSHHIKVITGLHKRLMKLEGALLKKTIAESIRKQEIRRLKPRETDMLVFILLTGIRGIKREMGYDNDFGKLQYAADTLADMAMKWLRK